MPPPCTPAPSPTPCYRFTPELVAAAAAFGLAVPALYFPVPAEWMSAWRGIADLYASAWIMAFVAVLILGWIGQSVRGLAKAPRPGVADPAPALHNPKSGDETWRVRVIQNHGWWAAVLLGVCAVELLAHVGERNGWVASSRPTSGVETWTTADGYAALFDGVPAQADGLIVLPLLRLFAGEGPPEPSELDRRAGHVYLVSLLQRPLGTYWAFAALNLLAWWAAALAVWWLGHWRWPGTTVPWVASLLVATGQGFAFVAGVPQAQGASFAALALVLVLAEHLAARPATGLRPGMNLAWLTRWAKLGWAAGCAGLVYLAYIPALLFVWLYDVGRTRGWRCVAPAVVGAAVTTAVTLGVVQAWQGYAGALLGLPFTSANNDTVGDAVWGWATITRAGLLPFVGQLHASSLRGLLGGAFYYPWWLLAAVGLTASGADNRRWSLAVIAAALLPAIAFSPRFNLPRVAYFCYPAVYLLAARGIEVVGTAAARIAGRAGRSVPAVTRTQSWVPGGGRLAAGVAVALVVMLVAIANVDVVGNQQLNVWFHYSQGNGW